MNPRADRGSPNDGATGVEPERAGDRPAEARSWEPPSWPSDAWDRPPHTRQRAIGWRGGRAH